MHLFRLTTSLQQAGLGIGEDKGFTRKCAGTLTAKLAGSTKTTVEIPVHIFFYFSCHLVCKAARRFGSLLCFSLQAKKHLDLLERAILSKFTQ